MLKNVLVLDLAGEQGSFCSKLLADLGATVYKIESPEGDPARKSGPFYRPQKNAEGISLSFSYNNSNKTGIIADLKTDAGRRAFLDLTGKADILIESFAPGRLETMKLGRRRLRRINPRLIHISITGFGHTGPKSQYCMTDSVVSAWGGWMHITGAQSGEPIKLFGRQSFYTASLYGAVAALLNLQKRKITGCGAFIDLSIQEAVASTLDHIMADYFESRRTPEKRSSDKNDLFSILPCRDGYIQIPILQNWETLIELMVSEKKGKDLADKQWQEESYRISHFGYILKVIAEWTKTYGKQHLFELGQTMRFPWAPVESPCDVLRSPQLKARQFFVRMPVFGKYSIAFPRLPYWFSSYAPPRLKPAPLLGERKQIIGMPTARPEENPGIHLGSTESNRSARSGDILKGLRVIDLTRMISGPYATRILADFGAEVIKVQSEQTASGAERNNTAGFCERNRNKRSLCVDLSQAEGREVLLQLAASSDIVIENYSPRVMANWGLTYERLKEKNPDLIMASISAMGHEGPWKNFVGFGPTFHAISGLIHTTSQCLDEPVNLGFAYGDIIAGLYAALAILSAVEYRDRTGKGQHIDLSIYEALCTLLGPALMEASIAPGQDAILLQREDCSEGDPSGCYPCMGRNRWCVISIPDEKQWETFCRISRKPELMAGKFATLEKRKRNQAELYKRISQWTAAHSAERIVHRLAKAGIAAGVVQDAKDLALDSHLAARRFFIALKHPVLGTVFSSRSALWPCNEKSSGWKAAPLLGEANRYVSEQVLYAAIGPDDLAAKNRHRHLNVFDAFCANGKGIIA